MADGKGTAATERDRLGSGATTQAPLNDWLLRAVVVALCVANVGGVGALLALGTRYPTLVSPGLLALGFGLRHGVDCDHIAAIDNVARKLADGARARESKPALVGLWFSLGHSSVVFVLCALVAGGSSYARDHVASLADVGGTVGGAVSAATLVVIGAVNLAGVKPLLAAARRARLREEAAAAGAAAADAPHEHGPGTHTHAVSLVEDGDATRLEGLGCLARCACCEAIFARIDAAWKMYPVGVLFGLGFDTASEVGLLALAATGRKGVPAPLVLVLPFLFTAGMALVDTADSVLVVVAFARGKGDAASALSFSAGLMGASALASLSIGSIEGLGLVAPLLPAPLGRPLAALAAGLDDHTMVVGLCVVGLFVGAIAAAWLGPKLAAAFRGKCCGKCRPRARHKVARYTELV